MACERTRRPPPRSGRAHNTLKMTRLEARHGPPRPAIRRWLSSFLVD